MSLLTLLTAVTALSVLWSAVSAAHDEHASLAGYALAISLGLLFGACSGWIVVNACRILAWIGEPDSERWQQFFGCMFVIAVLVWSAWAAAATRWVVAALV